jgi:hypothetical protein
MFRKVKTISVKQILPKMVPYISAVYAEHAFKKLGYDSNTKATPESIPILI